MKKKDTRHGRKGSPGARLPAILIVGGAALLGLAAFALFGGGREEYVPEVTGGPALRADREEENLGDIPLGQTVRVSFLVTNAGDRQLRFTEAPYVEVVEGC